MRPRRFSSCINTLLLTRHGSNEHATQRQTVGAIYVHFIDSNGPIRRILIPIIASILKRDIGLVLNRDWSCWRQLENCFLGAVVNRCFDHSKLTRSILWQRNQRDMIMKFLREQDMV